MIPRETALLGTIIPDQRLYAGDHESPDFRNQTDSDIRSRISDLRQQCAHLRLDRIPTIGRRQASDPVMARSA